MSELRLAVLAASGDVIQDLVVTGHDRDQVELLLARRADLVERLYDAGGPDVVLL
ncbi:MAG: hypothetical protein Tsb0020_23620 [Haliangiales bacterium]